MLLELYTFSFRKNYNFISLLLDIFPGAKALPGALVEMMGISAKAHGTGFSPDNIVKSDILLTSGDDGRCKFLKPGTAFCPPGWLPSIDRQSENGEIKDRFCFKNAGISYGDDDLCSSEGGERVWFPADGVYSDLFDYLQTDQEIMAGE